MPLLRIQRCGFTPLPRAGTGGLRARQPRSNRGRYAASFVGKRKGRNRVACLTSAEEFGPLEDGGWGESKRCVSVSKNKWAYSNRKCFFCSILHSGAESTCLYHAPRRADEAVNFLLIAATAGLLTGMMLTVDSDHWRGWTWIEVLKRLPLDNWRRYEEMVGTHPLRIKCMISGVIFAMGEYLAGLFTGAKPLKFDRKMIFKSALVGASLQAPIYHYYYEVTEHFFPSGPVVNQLIKTFIDQTATMAFWNAVYYSSMGILNGQSIAEVSHTVRTTAWPLLKTSWKLWPAAHIITYGFVPVQHRLLWVDFIEMVWCVILALFRESSSSSTTEGSEAESLESTTTPSVASVSASGSTESANGNGQALPIRNGVSHEDAGSNGDVMHLLSGGEEEGSEYVSGNGNVTGTSASSDCVGVEVSSIRSSEDKEASVSER